MGNCACRPPVTWVDDDINDDDDDDQYWDELLKSDQKVDKSATRSKARITASSTLVRIKINKKQLEELLSRAQVKGFTILDVISVGQIKIDEIQRHYWRPALQSIAEEPDQ